MHFRREQTSLMEANGKKRFQKTSHVILTGNNFRPRFEPLRGRISKNPVLFDV